MLYVEHAGLNAITFLAFILICGGVRTAGTNIIGVGGRKYSIVVI